MASMQSHTNLKSEPHQAVHGMAHDVMRADVRGVAGPK